METLLVIDGNSIINRAFYGTQNSFMKNAEGLPTGAVFGFLTIYFKNVDLLKPTHVAVAFDVHAPTFRHKMYTAYKGTRKPMPEDLAAQMPVLKELLDAMGVARIELEGYEADDILGTLSRRFGEAKRAVSGHTYILTGDRDSLQLVRDDTSVVLAGNKADVIYDAAAVAENYGGLTPDLLVDLKALQGDSSDNIPGVPGVGPKTAIDLISEYGSLDGVYANVDSIPKAGLRQKLIDNKSLAYLSKDLGRIDTNVPLSLGDKGVDTLALGRGDAAQLRAMTEKLEFKRWEKRLLSLSGDGGYASGPDDKGVNAGGASGAGTAFATASSKTATAKKATLDEGGGSSGSGAVDGVGNNGEDGSLSLFDAVWAETSDGTGAESGEELLSPEAFVDLVRSTAPDFLCIDYSASPAGFGASVTAGSDLKFTIYSSGTLHTADQDGGETKTCACACDVGHDDPFPGPVKELLEDASVKKVLFKSKPFLRECCIRNVDFKGLAGDLSLASYLLDSTRASDDMQMVVRFLAGRSFPAARPGLIAAHAESMKKLEAFGLTKLYNEVELPLAAVLAKMELRGFRVDPEVLKEEGRDMEKRISELQNEIYGYAGYEFNVNSTKQLAKVLFEDLGLKGSKKTKSGYSTDSDVLEGLYNDHPIVPCIIEYRQNAKLKSTYIDGLLNVIDRSTSRVHSTFNQNLTATGRLSSSEPNLQNIPVRSELGKLIRKAFVPSDGGHVLIDADYSQIELRVLASMSGDPLMIANFENDFDVHTSTAALVNRVPMEMVTPQMRSGAKAVNFGIVYGISSFGLARDLNISNYAAKQLIDNYFLHYPGIKAFMDGSVAFARDKGYAVTLLGRRRPLPELAPSNKYMTRQFGERVAMNMPVQGTAADIIKLAMINVENALEKGGFRSRLILQVHDELLIDAVKEEAGEVAELLRKEMENCFRLKVPLKVSVSVSDVSWYYCK